VYFKDGCAISDPFLRMRLTTQLKETFVLYASPNEVGSHSDATRKVYIHSKNNRLPKLIGMSRALDMILTGREVNADEALQFGLVNKLIHSKKSGKTCVEASIDMARLLCKFPQECMRLDRMSVYKGFGESILQGLKNENNRAVHSDVMRKAAAGAKRFVGGVGKHGSFDSFTSKL